MRTRKENKEEKVDNESRKEKKEDGNFENRKGRKKRWHNGVKYRKRTLQLERKKERKKEA